MLSAWELWRLPLLSFFTPHFRCGAFAAEWVKSYLSRMYYPAQSEFLSLAKQGNLVPVTRRILADLETPPSAYRKIRGQGESCLFESVEGGEHIGRYSFVGGNPRGII